MSTARARHLAAFAAPPRQDETLEPFTLPVGPDPAADVPPEYRRAVASVAAIPYRVLAPGVGREVAITLAADGLARAVEVAGCWLVEVALIGEGRRSRLVPASGWSRIWSRIFARVVSVCAEVEAEAAAAAQAEQTATWRAWMLSLGRDPDA